MKAIVLSGIKQMEIRDIPQPVIKNDNEVLIKMSVVGICGSDTHYYKSGRIGSQVAQFPMMVGHECAGVIEDAGSAVTRVKPGDRIAIDPAMSCRQCDQCKMGRQHTCRNLRFLGCPGQAEGCLCEYIVMPQECCFPIKDTMTMDQAAISEPLAIGIYAVKTSIPMPGAKIAILGAGPIGLCVLLAARAQGAEKIYVTEKVAERITMAGQAGADWAGNPDQQDIVKAINELEPHQMDVVFECCGQQEALDQAVEILRPGGKLMIVGIPEVDRISFDIGSLRRREINIQNVRRQNECVQNTLDMIDSGRINADFMVTHRFPLDQTHKAFELLTNYRDGIVKAMIDL
ncbi:MAG: alcohol dehydrogenase catalytic domain-containing protein [Sedimentisphaerales bacterium]|nr:alcohol dehydrogenase catalytic domain-containing protein [Sedimentisphaerales bacterium]